VEYRDVLIQLEEGFSVSCPALRGCHSQGATLEEALENIKSAIREWLDTGSDELSPVSIIERTVTVYPMPKIPGVGAEDSVRAFRKAGFKILRQGKHIVMSNGHVRLAKPRHTSINAYAMGAEEFISLLR
jgi:predicted RNase H-like HicB family nuclease